MPDDVSILVSWRWRAEDADGSNCCECGEMIYLSPMYRPVITVGDRDTEAEYDEVMCSSCYGYFGLS